MENNALISDQKEVCSVLNEFYVNIAKEIGINSQTVDGRNHPSLLAIQENSPEEGYSSFNFKPVDQELVMKTINKLNTKKATGVDNLPPKILKVAAEAISAPLSNIFNKSIKNGQFPDDLKDAQVSPLCKKL